MSGRKEFRFGFSGNAFDIDQLIDDAVRAESAGFDVFQIIDFAGALSPLVALAAVAQATSKIRLSPFVLNTALWNPSTICRDLATLDRISNGRLEVALGSGISLPDTRGLMPQTRDERFERLRETAAAIKAAVSEPGISPGFVQRPRLAIGGSVDRALKLAAEEADTFLIAAVPPVPKIEGLDRYAVIPERAATAAFLDRLRNHAGARADMLEIGSSAPVILTDDTDAALAELAKTHTYLTPEQIFESPKMLVGSLEQIVDQIIQRSTDLGITYQSLRAPTPEELAPVIEAVKSRSAAQAPADQVPSR
ncbi:LLM class flavin-dependent oxidoreductase [Streptomyces brasiliensis]|uniref:LLM class F420-dependent oxidoreductase n=1 Tax=Streptomyces brasiliensis TaxID=1954 RepID=A0A917P938_9ACTN|nr:LLM class flavin-dependent oxidoreductase [Streptomyces brasiliensis]GGJ67166.1 LLM class F420-dependent oxidoreductase [Streptomyces brasiliensis]